MTPQDIITTARERLGDAKKQRWTDKRMLNIVSQGQVDICKETRYIRREIHIPLVDEQLRYLLPADCIHLRRIEYRGDSVSVYTREDLDKGLVDAKETEFVGIKSNLNMSALELYPQLSKIPKLKAIIADGVELTTITIDTPLGVATGADATDTYEMVVDPSYGVTIGATMDYTTSVSDPFGEIGSYTYTGSEGGAELDNEYGVITDMEYVVDKASCPYGFVTAVNTHEVSGLHGMITDVSYIENSIKVFYDAIPERISTLNTAMVIPDMWEDILMRYVVGTALQDDNDANNIQRGEVELQKYTAQLKQIKAISVRDFASNNKEKFVTRYRSI